FELLAEGARDGDALLHRSTRPGRKRQARRGHGLGDVVGAGGPPFPDFVAARGIVRGEAFARAFAPFAADEVFSSHRRSKPEPWRRPRGATQPKRPATRALPRHASPHASARSDSPG